MNVTEEKGATTHNRSRAALRPADVADTQAL